MELPIHIPTQEEIYQQACLLANLGNALLASIKSDDTENMVRCAKEIHKIHAIITARRCAFAIHHILQPFTVMVWIGIGGIAGATLMLLSHVNARINILLLTASFILSTTAKFIEFNGIKISNAIVKIILNKSQKPADRDIALIIEQYRSRLTT